ncbi:WSC domain-containing protein 2, partial [Tinamus guttatus]
ARYVGCYEDSPRRRTLRGVSFFDYKKMTVFRCQDNCAERGYLYAGLEFGAECYCGHKIQAGNVSEAECAMACKGERSDTPSKSAAAGVPVVTPVSRCPRAHGAGGFLLPIQRFSCSCKEALGKGWSSTNLSNQVKFPHFFPHTKENTISGAGFRAASVFPGIRSSFLLFPGIASPVVLAIYMRTRVAAPSHQEKGCKDPRAPGASPAGVLGPALTPCPSPFPRVPAGFKGERDHWRSGRTICVKTHESGQKEIESFDAAILLIRNPYKALMAEFNRKYGGHIGFAAHAHWQGKEWPEFVRTYAPWWAAHTLDWLRFGRNVLVVHFEDLKRDLFAQLQRMVGLLGIAAREDRLLCVEGQKDGNFKRSGLRKLEYDPYTPEMRALIGSYIKSVDAALRLRNLSGVPDDYSPR